MKRWKYNSTGWLLTSIIIASTPVYAQSTAVVAGGSCQQNSLAATVSKFRAALARKNVTVESQQSLINKLGGIPSMSMEEINHRLEARREDLLNMDYQKAINPLLEEIKELMLQPPSQKRCDSVRDAYVKLAWAYYKSKANEKDYRAAVERIARIGTFKLDFRLFPPTFHQYVDNTREELKRGANSSLSILTNPVGLMVHIDGCPVGHSPQRLRVPEGKYQVDIEFPSGRGLFQKVVAKGDTTVEFNKGFEGSIFADKGPCVAFSKDNKERIKSLARLAGLLKVQSVAMVREHEPVEGKKYLAVQLVDKNKNSREAEINLLTNGATDDELDDNLEKLATFIATGKVEPPVKSLPLRADNPIINVSSAPKPKAKWQRTVAWSLAGLAAALAGAAVYEQVHMRNIANDASPRRNSDGSYNHDDLMAYQLSRDFNTADKLRTGFIIGTALAAAGSGAFFYVSWDRQPAKITESATSQVLFTVGGNF